ncbi:MAG: hypothetical protein JOZ49_10400 [Mycolicibacterium sp.]|nr:hypothetical protein [Mycolicibacterium sp.]
MTFVNGELQARFMARIRWLDPQRCLAVPVDVSLLEKRGQSFLVSGSAVVEAAEELHQTC